MLTGRDRFEGDGSEEDGTATRDRRGLARIGKRLRKKKGRVVSGEEKCSNGRVS